VLVDELGLERKRDTRFGNLSGGQQQRLSIALALIGRPRIAILDELTTGLDPAARRETWQLIERVRDRGVTLLLITHFMEEAQRLCDRLAIFDRGRVVATDTPAGLVASAGDEHRLRFLPSAPVDPGPIAALPEVTEVRLDGDAVLVSGNGAVVHAVLSRLGRDGVVPNELRVDQPSLDDAFVRLTGRPFDDDDATAATAAEEHR
jgi:ABC-2 type transport system ATP-binding protein